MRHAALSAALLLILSGTVWAAEPVALTDELALKLIKKTPAFSGPDRTQSRIIRQAPLGEGHVLELRWSEGDRIRTALVGIARTDLGQPPSPWLAQDQGWGIVSILEDKTWDDFIAGMKHERVRVNEPAVVGDMRTLIAAEAAYQTVNDGHYGEPSCLKAPWDCIPTYGRNLPEFLTGLVEGEKLGYRRRFHAGAKIAVATPGARAGLSAWALTAVPIQPGNSGVRAFCADASGRICSTPDGSEPAVVDGTCPSTCLVIK